jgi:hypothetical protein
MYLTPEIQTQVFVQFHLSLQQHKFLVLGQSERLVTCLQQSLFKLVHSQIRTFTRLLHVGYNNQLISIPLYHMPMLNNGLRDGTSAKYLANPVNSSPKGRKQERFQLEMQQQEIEWLREQVRSLQDALYDRIQQQQEVEQELEATKKELELINQEIQYRIQAR